jgi:hypothetical protein
MQKPAAAKAITNQLTPQRQMAVVANELSFDAPTATFGDALVFTLTDSNDFVAGDAISFDCTSGHTIDSISYGSDAASATALTPTNVSGRKKITIPQGITAGDKIFISFSPSALGAMSETVALDVYDETDPQNATKLKSGSGTINFTTEVSIAISGDSEVAVGDELSFTVSTTHDVPEDVTLSIAATNGTITGYQGENDSSVTASSNSVVIKAGTNSSTVTVVTALSGDTNIDREEVALSISSASPDVISNAASVADGLGYAREVTLSDQAFRLYLPGDGTNKHYLRFGAKQTSAPPDETDPEIWSDKTPGKVADGIFQYTDGDWTAETRGDVHRINHGASTDYFYSEQFNYATDAIHNHYMGYVFDSTAAAKGDVMFGPNYSSSAALNVAMDTGFNFAFGASFSYTATAGTSIELSSKHIQEANDLVHLKVDPDDDKLETFIENVAPWMATATAGVTSLTGILAAADEGSLEGDHHAFSRIEAGSLFGMGSILSGLATIHYLREKRAAKKAAKKGNDGGDKPSTQIRMSHNDVLIEAHGLESEKTDEDKRITIKCDTWGGNASTEKSKAFPANKYAAGTDTKQVFIDLLKQSAADKDKIELRCGKASLVMTSDGSITLQNDAGSFMSLWTDGSAVIGNKKGHLAVDDEDATIAHDTEVDAGIKASGENKPKTLKGVKLANSMQISASEIKLDNTKISAGKNNWKVG